MNQIVPRSTTDVAIPPIAVIASGSIEEKIGLVAQPSRAMSTQSIADGHRNLIRANRQGDTPLDVSLQFSGYRDPLVEVTWALDPEHKTDWLYMPIRLDESLKRGLMMPPKIKENIRRAEGSGWFDDLYIVHAVPSEPNRSTDSPVPWKKLESPTMRRLRTIVNGSTRLDKGVWGSLSLGIRGVGVGTEWLIKGAVAVVVAAIGLAVAVSAVLAVAIVAVAGAALVASVTVMAVGVAGVDPVIYGVRYIADATGKPVAMCYKLAQWD